MCEEHKDNQENKDILQKFKDKCLKQTQLPEFSRNIQLSHFCFSPTRDNVRDVTSASSVETIQHEIEHASESGGLDPVGSSSTLSVNASSFVSRSEENEDFNESAVYMLQKIRIAEEEFNIFYDNGCKNFVSKFTAVQRLGGRACIEKPGPLTLRGVGGIEVNAPHGEYNVELPRADGCKAVMSGICLDQITFAFPTYPLKGQVENDIRSAYQNSSGDLQRLPMLPACVGGETDFMIGIKYLRQFPTLIFQLPSGLSIYQSKFPNPDGSFGVVGGQHRVFTQIENHCHLAASTFLTEQLQLFRSGYQLNPDISLLGYKKTDEECIQCHACPHNDPHHVFIAKQSIFNEAEIAGSEITFRCIKCRSCKDCKNHERIEALSIREEVEQDLIDRSVTVDINSRETEASLPLMDDPTIKLAPNRHKAEKTYRQQLKALENPNNKAALTRAEAALQAHGFVEWSKNLPPDVQKFLNEHAVQNFIPWRIAWKSDSVTSPVRPVFDASQPTPSGYSLNSITAKGKNSLNVLIEIFLRWRIHPIAFHNDVQKMYNKVKLRQADWCLQRYLFQEDLDPHKPPEEKIIKTLIYGVTSSGNQAQRGLRLTAELSKDEFPEAYEIVHKDTYMDDIMSGCQSIEEADQRADEMEIMLSRGGFTLKGFTMSGRNPDPSLSADGISILVAGHFWFSEKDKIALNIKDLNFARKRRGRKVEEINEIPSKLNRLHCTSKVYEIFDMSGLNTPIVANRKLDLHKPVIEVTGMMNCIERRHSKKGFSPKALLF